MTEKAVRVEGRELYKYSFEYDNEDLKKENSERIDAERSLVLYRDHLEKTVEERT